MNLNLKQNINLINIYNLSKINVKINNPELIKMIEDSKKLQNDIERINWSMRSGNSSSEIINLLNKKTNELTENINKINIKLNELNYTEIPKEWLSPIEEIVTPNKSMNSIFPSFSSNKAKKITHNIATFGSKSLSNISNRVNKFSGKVSNIGSRAKNITRNSLTKFSGKVSNFGSRVKKFSGNVLKIGSKSLPMFSGKVSNVVSNPIRMNTNKKNNPVEVESITIQTGGKYSKKIYKSIRKSKRKY